MDVCRVSVCDPEEVCNPCEWLLLQSASGAVLTHTGALG